MKKIRILIFLATNLFFLAFPSDVNLSVLLNAEPFGFGPSAAITEFFPYLRKKIKHLSYIGTGHTLDLQRNLPYDQVYNYQAVDPDQQRAKFNAIAKDYDVFITASNYEAAEWAKALGLKLIIYDPLTWYWSILPAVISKADLYVAQNFFGVAERLAIEHNKLPETVIVPAIVPDLYTNETNSKQEGVLVNMGGLSNAFIPNDDFIIFAIMVFSSVREILGTNFYNAVYTTSTAIANATKDIHPTTTLQPQQIQKILSNSKLAIMTSGLGNIYEASMLQRFVIWLPPANDSQGQQIKLLHQHKMIDFSIDWHDIFEDEIPIDYFAPQQEVLKRIANCMQKLSSHPKAKETFKALLKNAFTCIKTKPLATPVLAKLAQLFGTGGAKQAAESILLKLSVLEKQKTL